jgi:glycosyltransferase involved in cell wall biosynthesis
MLTVARAFAQDGPVDVFWDHPQDIDASLRRFGIDTYGLTPVPNVFASGSTFLKRLIATTPYDRMCILSDGSIPLVAAKRLYLHIQQPLRERTFSVMEKFKLSRVEAVVCNSKFTASHIPRLFSEKSVVIYPPVTIGRISTHKKKSILSVGRLRMGEDGNDFKKFFSLIDFWKALVTRTEAKGWKYTIACSTTSRDERALSMLKKKADTAGVELLVNITYEQIWKHYAEASLFWHASGYGEDLQAHPHLAEHFGIATVEAMSTGCVPVVIDAGGQKEIVTSETGVLWKTKDSCIQATLQLMKDPTMRLRMGQAAHKRSLDFSTDACLRTIADVMI